MKQFRRTSALAMLLLSALGAATLSGCSKTTDPAADKSAQTAAKTLDPILVDPKVGDLYAAEISHFSGAGYEGADNDEKVYGLMKVVKVDADKITLITENSGWPRERGAINDLRGDLASIEWDETEEIPLFRKELAGLASSGKIAETRRLP